MTTVQLALRLHKLPEEIEQMDSYWLNRLILYLDAEAEARDNK
jgi:hypothetical protein